MKTLHIHLGYPKSGSSAVQVSLRQNEQELRKHGLAYPLLDKREIEVIKRKGYCSGNGIFIIEALKRGKPLEPLLKQLENCEEDNVLLSTENFAGVSREVAQPFLSWLKDSGYSIKLHAFHREPFDLVLSGYSQAIKNGRMTASLEASCKRFNDPQQFIRDLFQPEFSIQERPFSENKHDIVNALFSMMGLDIKIENQTQKRVNRSLSVQEAFFIKHLNKSDLSDRQIELIVADLIRSEFTGGKIQHTENTVRLLCDRLGLDFMEHRHHIGKDTGGTQKEMIETALRIQDILVARIME